MAGLLPLTLQFFCIALEIYGLFLSQNDLIIEMPRRRKQVSRYGKQDEAVHISDLETSGSDADYDEASTPLSAHRGVRRKKRGGRHWRDYEDSSAMISSNVGGHGEGYSRSDCFNVEKMLLIFGYAACVWVLYAFNS